MEIILIQFALKTSIKDILFSVQAQLLESSDLNTSKKKVALFDDYGD